MCNTPMDNVFIAFKNGEEIIPMGEWVSDASQHPKGFPVPKILEELRACIDEIMNEHHEFDTDPNEFSIYIKTQDGFSLHFGYHREGYDEV